MSFGLVETNYMKQISNKVLLYSTGTIFNIPGSSVVKNLPAVQETWVQFLGREDPLEKEMANHSSILAREIPWTEKSGRLQSMGLQRVSHSH